MTKKEYKEWLLNNKEQLEEYDKIQKQTDKCHQCNYSYKNNKKIEDQFKHLSEKVSTLINSSDIHSELIKLEINKSLCWDCKRIIGLNINLTPSFIHGDR